MYIDSFRWKKNLRTLSEENPYQCSYCHNIFSRSENLNVHIKLYTSEKLYQCRHCGKSFSRSLTLKLTQWLILANNHINAINVTNYSQGLINQSTHGDSYKWKAISMWYHHICCENKAFNIGPSLYAFLIYTADIHILVVLLKVIIFHYEYSHASY